MPSPRAPAVSDRWPTAWVLSTSAAIVALAYWQQSPEWGRLAAVGLTTALSAWFTVRVHRPRAMAMVTVAALAAALLLAASDTATLVSMRRNWPAWSAAEREARAQRVAESLTEIADVLRAAVQSPLTESAFVRQVASGGAAAVAPPLQRGIESALLLFRRDTLVARAGQLHTPVAPLAAPGLRLVDGAFHTSLVARARSADGRIELVATALLASAPPADRFARSLLQALPGDVDGAHTIIESPDSVHVDAGTTVVVVPDGPRRLARVRATTYTEGEARLALEQRARLRASLVLAFAVVAYLTVAWRRPARTVQRWAAAGAVLVAVALAPLSGLSNLSLLFDPASYFAPMGGPLTSTVAALLVTATLLLAMLLFRLRTPFPRRSRLTTVLLVLLGAALAIGGPYLLRDLARGIAVPAAGAGFGLWIAWQLALALVAATILLAGAASGQAALGARRGVPPAIAPLIALSAAVLAPVLLDAPGVWPSWYPLLWVAAIAALAVTRRGLPQVVAAAVVAGTGAVTLTWGATVRARTALAQYDLERLPTVDENAQRLLDRFAIAQRDETRPAQSAGALLRRYAASELAQAGYPARLARWVPDSDTAVSVLALTPVADSQNQQAYLATVARTSGQVELGWVNYGLESFLLAAVPAPDGVVTTIAVPPRTRLLQFDPFAAITGVAGTRVREDPYRLSIGAPMGAVDGPASITWRRRADALHGDGLAGDRLAPQRVHVEIDLGRLERLLPRGALLVMLDVVAVLWLWSVTALADGALGRLLQVRRARWSRSYRVRLSGALLTFFIAPAAIFALWAWYRLQDDDRAARELLVRETLRVAAAEQEQRVLGTAPSSTGAPLFLYRHGLLATASDPLLDALAPLGRLLPGTLNGEDFGADDIFATRRVQVGAVRTLVGFRQLGRTGLEGARDGVLATPARGDEFALDARREDLGILVLFATMLGALAAIWSSGVAARSLARPVGALREAALAIAAGREAPSLGTAPATEFAPVYRAFGRMASDLATSRRALEAAQRRTAAVLQHVASGVLALLDSGAISLANPRAEALLGRAVRAPDAGLDALPATLRPLVERCRAFLAGTEDEQAFELTLQGRQLQARLTRLPSGAVLTIDDITDLASAQRVLAWGEMARQVAHEIKNPLTPIRLGVQHLRRAYRDGRGDFAQILETNVTRVLAEIDHLDQIARAFSRYGTAPANRTPAVAVDVGQVARDVLALERLGDGDDQRAPVHWLLDAPETGGATLRALAQPDELREVLLNLLENARLADATTVRVQVRDEAGQVRIDVIDDGTGIAADVLPQIFEPHFSTRTSGSGLGLAISRRLIEGWGGTIDVASRVGEGTTVRIGLRVAVQREAGADDAAGRDV
ncbi:MAG: ATP-binding protein [Gemmatimonadaceae bacterium]